MIYRPGLLVPVAGYLAVAFATIAAIILAVVAPAGGHHPMPHAGDWGAVWARLGGGEVPVVFAWALWKVASQRVILNQDEMQILTWGVRWSIGRDEVSDVVLQPSGMRILLLDGCQIRPSMFWSTPGLAAGLQLGLLKNVASRETIRDAILSWRHVSGDLEQQPARYESWWPCRHHWQVRGNWLLLIALCVAIAAESIVITALG